MKRNLAVIIAAILMSSILSACASETSAVGNNESSAAFSTEIEVAAAQETDEDSASDINSVSENADQQQDLQSDTPSPAGSTASSKGSAASGSAAGAKTAAASASSQTKGTASSAASTSGSAQKNTASSSASSGRTASTAGTSSTAASSRAQSSSKASSSKSSSTGSIGTFSMTDLAGNTANESILNNYDLTMINVWATYCNPCISEIPDLDKLYKQVKGSGVNIIGVALDGPGNLSGIQRVVDKTGASYKMYIPSSSMLNNSFMSSVTFVPTTFFADRNGNLVGSPVSGTRTAAAWEKVINERLAQARR